ncbi:distribution and morphology protein 34 [Sporothrix brasiliensis 5110]|uniref:Mitochondrial distribution and morphology protein 34 n=1 Tax=Sporothrix brasiliensis 5110 TaxID=1398154 RepID=A0A0C2FAS0_9PEZI|nr:distribution and morphology protein 34 [Sporothrix brasiliensis 5110]KIH88148.1 distribution and morphology protein 34 [Sporothrix brasiliensis 5110]
MAFNFNWSPLAADASFYQRAREMLTTALNKSPKPPIIVDDIIVTEFNLGSVPPDLEILEIGDIAADRFRGIFKMCYAGDAFLTLKTRVQANPLNTYLSSKPSFTSPDPLAAASGLTIPLQITLSEIKLSAFIIVVFSKQKGLTLVFRNDPLESLKVSSTFDSIQFVRDYLQRTIEGKLRDLMMDELPAIIHRLSLQLWSPDQVPKDEDATANAEDDDGEMRVNPLADAPSDAVDINGNLVDAGEIPSLSTTGSPESQSLFSQKNLLRLAALTDSHRTLSLFTPGIREVVFRAWAGPSDRQDTPTGGNNSPPFATPSLSRGNSFTAAATNTTASTTTYTFSDTGSQVHGHLPSRPSMVNLSSATTGLSLGSNSQRHPKSYGNGRRKKTRVVNLRKSSSGSSTKDIIAGSAPVSEAGDTASDSVSVQGPLSEPIMPTSIPEEDEAQDMLQTPPRPLSPQEPLSNIGAALAAASIAPGVHFQENTEKNAAESALPASRPQQKRREVNRAGVPTTPIGGIFEPRTAGPFSPSKESAPAVSSPLAGTPMTPPSAAFQDSSPVMEKDWIMKMASEIARRVYDENRKNPAFWDDRDDAPPPAYEATR